MKRCKFCGCVDCTYIGGYYLCDDPECEKEADEYERDRYEQDMQDAIDRVNMDHGNF